MRTESNAVIMRIFLGEADRYEGEVKYKYLLNLLKNEGIAGATVFRGIMGYGSSAHIHSASILDISEDLPVIIEAMDTREKIEAFIPKLEDIIPSGHMVLENVKVIKFTPNT